MCTRKRSAKWLRLKSLWIACLAAVGRSRAYMGRVLRAWFIRNTSLCSVRAVGGNGRNGRDLTCYFTPNTESRNGPGHLSQAAGTPQDRTAAYDCKSSKLATSPHPFVVYPILLTRQWHPCRVSAFLLSRRTRIVHAQNIIKKNSIFENFSYS